MVYGTWVILSLIIFPHSGGRRAPPALALLVWRGGLRVHKGEDLGAFCFHVPGAQRDEQKGTKQPAIYYAWAERESTARRLHAATEGLRAENVWGQRSVYSNHCAMGFPHTSPWWVAHHCCHVFEWTVECVRSCLHPWLNTSGNTIKVWILCNDKPML